MKLFLNWLSYDFRRSRRVLITWVLLVTSTAVLMGWLHLHVLTTDFPALKLSLWLPPLLIGQLVAVAFGIFGGDPAGEIQAFWKTRPPSGYAVAASKLVLAGFFLLLLPMAAIEAVTAACVIPGYVAITDDGFSTAGGVWMLLSGFFCVCSFGAAAARDPANSYLRTGLVILAIAAAALIGFAPALPLPWISPVTPVFRPWLILPATALALPVAAVLFLAARRSRTPHPVITLLTFVLPVLVVRCALAWFHEPLTVPQDNSFPVLSSETVEKIRIPAPAPEHQRLSRVGGGWSTGEGAVPVAIYQADLSVSGLPPGSTAFGRWLSLTLTAPDGRSISIDPDTSLRRSNLRRFEPGKPEAVSGCDAVFNEEELAPFLGQRCVVRGTLRLVLITQHDVLLDPWQADVVETGLGRYRFVPETEAETSQSPASWDSLWRFPELRGIERQPVPEIQWAAVHPALGYQIVISEARTTGAASPFLQYLPTTHHLAVYFGGRRQDEAAAYRKPFETSVRTDWRLRLTWHEPSGRTDVPLALENILVPAPGE